MQTPSEADAADDFVPATQIPRSEPHPFGDTGPRQRTDRGDGTEAVEDDAPTTGDDTRPTASHGVGEASDPMERDAETGTREREARRPHGDGTDGSPAESSRRGRRGKNAPKGLSHQEGVLSTGCGALDILLDGGIESDAITLVFGEAGSGKTNLALQLARTAAAAGKRVAYVDTEGVSATRLGQIFDAVGDAGTARDAEDRLLFYTPFDIQQQERLVRNATMAPDLGLVVVDSINMHYRLHMDGTDEMQREANRSIVQQLHHLTTFARQRHVPVLVTGQVYGTEDGTYPFARRVMEHLVKALVRFHKTPDGGRKATVLKHRSIPEGRQARFRIAQEGLIGDDEE